MGQNHPRGNQSALNEKHSKFPKVAYHIQLSSKQPQTMEVELPCDQASYKKWKQDLKIYQKHFSDKKYLLLPKDHKYQGGGMCSQSGTVKITYPKLPYVLEDEINTIKAQKNTFSEAEIWKLLHVLVSAKKEYLKLQKTFSNELGNVNPKNIFLNDNNQIKVANALSWPNYIDGYRNAVLREPAYLSPEDMKLLGLGALNNDSNTFSEDFSIGMTLLSVGLVQNLEDLYNFSYPTFKTEQFQTKLMFWKTSMFYSEILRAVVLALLEIDPQDRLTFDQIGEFLKPHVANIQTGRPLVISKLNPKIQKSVDQLAKELPDLIQQRFEKYSPKKQRQDISITSPLKDFTKDSLYKVSKIYSLHKIKGDENQKEIQVNNYKANGIQLNSQGTDPMIVKSAQKMFQPVSIMQPTITKVKSQTRFTYSNRPLQNVSPAKFVLNNQNGTVSQEQILISEKQGQNLTSKTKNFAPNFASNQETSIMPSPRANKIQQEQRTQAIKAQNNPQNPTSTELIVEQKKMTTKSAEAMKKAEEHKTAQIAERLVSQGLKHADSQVHAQQSNRESTSTQINKLEFLEALNALQVTPSLPSNPIFQHKSDQNYHTYTEVLVNTNFNSAWDEFLNIINHPDQYFPELQHKIAVSNQTIEIPPGKVKLDTNKEEGKIHLENVSEKCKGEILGGVSKNSSSQVQIWFNSSYLHDGKPFPTGEYFKKGLEKLKQKLEEKST